MFVNFLRAQGIKALYKEQNNRFRAVQSSIQFFVISFISAIV